MTALVSLSAGGAITGFSFVPKAAADFSSPSSMPLNLVALRQSVQGAGPDRAAPSHDAMLRAAIVHVARHYLRMAGTRTPAEMEAIIWQHDSIDGADHGQSCAAFASLTLELGAQVVGGQSWVSGGESYPWPLHGWADVRVEPNPASLGIISIQQDAQAHDRWHPLGDGYTPLPGDWVLFDGHVEVVTKDAGGVLYTIGGDSLPNFSVNAHEYPGPMSAAGVVGFVDNGSLPDAGPAAGTAGAEGGTAGAEGGTAGAKTADAKTEGVRSAGATSAGANPAGGTSARGPSARGASAGAGPPRRTRMRAPAAAWRPSRGRRRFPPPGPRRGRTRTPRSLASYPRSGPARPPQRARRTRPRAPPGMTGTPGVLAKPGTPGRPETPRRRSRLAVPRSRASPPVPGPGVRGLRIAGTIPHPSGSHSPRAGRSRRSSAPWPPGPSRHSTASGSRPRSRSPRPSTSRGGARVSWPPGTTTCSASRAPAPQAACRCPPRST